MTDSLATDAAAHLAWGWDHLSAGDWAAAVAELSDALRLDPGLADAYHSRAGAYLLGWHLPAALADATAAIDLAPNHSPYWLTRANVNYHLRDVPAAWVDYRSAYQLDPDGNARAVVEILAGEARDRLAASLKDCGNHLRYDAGDFHSLAKRALLTILQGRPADAEEDLAAYGRLNPAGVPQLRHYVAVALGRPAG